MSQITRNAECQRTVLAWMQHNSVDVELNKLLMLMRGFSNHREENAFFETAEVRCFFDYFLLARSVACFLISCKLFEVTIPSFEGCLKALNQIDVISKEEFASLVRAEERMIVRDCEFDFLYKHVDDDGNEEHLHSMFDGKMHLLLETLGCFLHTQHRCVRWPMIEMWNHINQLATTFPVQESTATHAYMVTFMAWQKMKLWDSNLSLYANI